jgi:hypothetical protein
VRGLTTAASIWATTALGVAVGAGTCVVAVGATVLSFLTLVGLRRVRDLVRRFAISKEEFAIGAGPEFDLSALHELARAEGATLRQLDFEHEAGSDRLLMIVTLPARYPPATFMRLVGELPGVRGVEWDGQLLDAVRVAVATVHPSCSAAPRRPGEGPAVRRGDWSAGCQEAGLRAGSFSPSTFATRLQASWRSPSAQDSSVGSE